MRIDTVIDLLEQYPVIAAASDSQSFKNAIESEPQVLFHLNLNILSAAREISAAKQKNKYIFVHIDLAEGVGKDKAGIEFLASIGADGIISTRSHLIKAANDLGLLTVQRFFALDSKGVYSIQDMISVANPCLIEIMPGVIPKIIKHFSSTNVPIIAGGLIENKSEITAALGAGALAISTGKRELWSL